MVELVGSWLLDIVSRILFDLVNFSRAKNDLLRLQPLCLLEKLPEDEQSWEYSNHEVREEEVGDVPVTYDSLLDTNSGTIAQELDQKRVYIPGRKTV